MNVIILSDLCRGSEYRVYFYLILTKHFVSWWLFHKYIQFQIPELSLQAFSLEFESGSIETCQYLIVSNTPRFEFGFLKYQSFIEVDLVWCELSLRYLAVFQCVAYLSRCCILLLRGSLVPTWDFSSVDFFKLKKLELWWLHGKHCDV